MKSTMGIYYQSKLGIVRSATLADALTLSEMLRSDDIAEVWKSDHKTPQEALMQSYLDSSLCFTIERNESPIAMFGAVPSTLFGNSAVIWLLASPEIEKIQGAFLKHARGFINIMLSYYPLLYNYISTENRKALRWIKWCGAELGPEMPYGIEQATFQYFEISRR